MNEYIISQIENSEIQDIKVTTNKHKIFPNEIKKSMV